MNNNYNQQGTQQQLNQQNYNTAQPQYNPLNDRGTLSNQYLENINNSMITQTNYMRSMVSELNSINVKLGFILFLQLLPAILAGLGFLLALFSGVSIFNILSRLF